MKKINLEVEQSVNDEGQLIREEFWVNEKLHNEHGPAVREEFHLHGNRVDSLPDSCEGKVVEIDGKRYRLASV